MLTLLLSNPTNLKEFLYLFYYNLTLGNPLLGLLVFLIIIAFIMFRNNFPAAIFSSIISVLIYSVSIPTGNIQDGFSAFRPFLIYLIIIIGLGLGYVWYVTMNKQWGKIFMDDDFYQEIGKALKDKRKLNILKINYSKKGIDVDKEIKKITRNLLRWIVLDFKNVLGIIVLLFFISVLFIFGNANQIFIISGDTNGIVDTTIQTNSTDREAFLATAHNWSARNDFNANDGLETMDLNVIDDLNVYDRFTVINNSNSCIYLRAVGLTEGSICYTGLIYNIDDDVVPTSNATFNLGTSGTRWNTIFVNTATNLTTITASGTLTINVNNAADRNVHIVNNAAGSVHLMVEGDFFDKNSIHVDRNANIHGMLNIDQNITVPDENKGYILNGRYNIGTIITAGTSGSTFATNASIPAGVRYACLYVLDTTGVANSCSSTTVVGAVIAKAT